MNIVTACLSASVWMDELLLFKEIMIPNHTVLRTGRIQKQLFVSQPLLGV